MRPPWLVAVAVTGAAIGCGEAPTPRAEALPVTALLADDDTAGYLRASEPRAFSFPSDHGPHPGYRHEWWYFTGNLEGKSGDYGFQLTFFRSALRPDSSEVRSEWAASDAYMAHFALTDVETGRFRAFERFQRSALELAGAGGPPLRVWLGDWAMEEVGPSAVGGTPAFRLQAAEDGTAIDLRVTPLQPPVLQGAEGLSAKGPEPGNASYYYSLPRLRAEGTVTVDGEPRTVTGTAWLDREWGTSALGEGVVGWDWFALQLESDAELMFYRLRRDDGSTDRFSAGSFVEPDGRVRPLAADDVILEVGDRWTGPGGVSYPSSWTLRVPRLDLTLGITPRVADQELDLTFRYWEGAVTVDGERAGAPTAGVGYVELTGYESRPGG